MKKSRNLYYDINAKIRNEIWDNNDIGILSLFSVEQINRFINWLDLKPEMHILDVCCGNGKVTAYITKKLACKSYGIDSNGYSIRLAKQLMKLDKNISFLKTDIKNPLPFSNCYFDALICIESIIYFSKDERLKIFKEWYRVLKPNSKLIFTDSCIISGIIADRDLRHRGIYGGYFFLSPNIQELLIQEVGFELVNTEDITQGNAAIISKKRKIAREKKKQKLQELEGDKEFNKTQLFVEACDQLYNNHNSFLLHTRTVICVLVILFRLKNI